MTQFAITHLTLDEKYVGPFWVLLWIPSTRDKAAGSCLFMWDRQKAKLLESDLGGVPITFLGEKAYIKVGPVPEAPILQVAIYGHAPQRGGGTGPITVGQFNNLSEDVVNSFFQVEFGKRMVVGTVKFQSNKKGVESVMGALMKCMTLSNEFAGYLFGEQSLIENETWLLPSFRGVHQPVIGCQAGVMPRALFYYSMQHPRVTDRWLFAQLDTYFEITKCQRTFPTSQAELTQVMTTIVMGLATYTGQFKYQPDQIYIKTNGQTSLLEFEHFSKTVFRFKAGDCEDLGWGNGALLTALQRRKIGSNREEWGEFLDMCTRVMDFYIVTNCLCQATKPELSYKNGGDLLNLHLAKFSPWLAQSDEKKMQAWHMTCILYPKREFLAMLDIPEARIKEHYRGENRGFMHWNLPRMYAEGTALIYPNPEKHLNPDNIQTFLTDCGDGETCCVLPAADNLQEDTCIYGGMLQLMTDYFIHRGENPHSTLFMVRVLVNGVYEVGVPERCYSFDKDLYKLEALGDISKEDLHALEQEPPFEELDIDLPDYYKRKKN